MVRGRWRKVASQHCDHYHAGVFEQQCGRLGSSPRPTCTCEGLAAWPSRPARYDHNMVSSLEQQAQSKARHEGAIGIHGSLLAALATSRTGWANGHCVQSCGRARGQRLTLNWYTRNSSLHERRESSTRGPAMWPRHDASRGGGGPTSRRSLLLTPTTRPSPRPRCRPSDAVMHGAQKCGSGSLARPPACASAADPLPRNYDCRVLTC